MDVEEDFFSISCFNFFTSFQVHATYNYRARYVMEADFPIWLNIAVVVIGFCSFNNAGHKNWWIVKHLNTCVFVKKTANEMYFVYTLCIIFCMYVIQGLKLSFGSTCQLSKWSSGCTRQNTFSLAKYTPPSTKSNQIKQTTGSNCAAVVIFYSVYCNYHSANAKLFDITTDLVSLKSFLLSSGHLTHSLDATPSCWLNRGIVHHET